MRIIRSIYLMPNLFIAIGVIVSMFIVGSFNTLFLQLAKFGLMVLAISFAMEVFVLFKVKNGINAERNVPDRLSSGDKNFIYIKLLNKYSFRVNINLIDDLPVQFQIRDKNFKIAVPSNESRTVKYHIKPTERGSYTFGNLNVFVSTVLNLVQKKYVIKAEKEIAVYPSYIQVKKYAFLAISNNLQNDGMKKIRKVGHNYEFDQIREFVLGDDYRSINWKATAKMNQIMVNQYQDEKSQNVVVLINKGRVMKMPFEEMTLLDHSINSALVMLNIAYQKDDYAGLLTFNKDIDTVISPSPDRRQMKYIQDALYNETTNFTEPNYEKLFTQIRHSIKKRSLIFLYTNFESMISLKRELPSLQSIAKYHRLIVIFFKNTELDHIIRTDSESIEQIYIKTIATKFQYEKELIAKELHKYGIDSVLTYPKNLTINSINKYLEIKAKLLM